MIVLAITNFATDIIPMICVMLLALTLMVVIITMIFKITEFGFFKAIRHWPSSSASNSFCMLTFVKLVSPRSHTWIFDDNVIENHVFHGVSVVP